MAPPSIPRELWGWGRLKLGPNKRAPLKRLLFDGKVVIVVSVLSIAILIFILLESLNVLTLYFNPGSSLGNGIGVFDAWEMSKADPCVHQLVRYLVNWVAGTKLIFIALLVVILITAGETTKLFTVVAMIASISSFFWRLFPAICSQDKAGQISPAGYSKTLGWMIAGFMGLFALALAWSLFTA